MVRPSPRTLVVIQTDPTKSHRAVEALRIALGLGSHNEGQDISIILCVRAPHPLALQVLGSQPPSATSPLVVLLSAGNTASLLPQRVVYRLTEGPPSQEQHELTYEQLVEMIFTADRVMTW